MEDLLAGGRPWKGILTYTRLWRPRAGGTAGTGTARPLCILRRSTEIVSILPPMMMSKDFGPRR
jgi:hypothetical protein